MGCDWLYYRLLNTIPAVSAISSAQSSTQCPRLDAAGIGKAGRSCCPSWAWSEGKAGKWELPGWARPGSPATACALEGRGCSMKPEHDAEGACGQWQRSSTTWQRDCTCHWLQVFNGIPLRSVGRKGNSRSVEGKRGDEAELQHAAQVSDSNYCFPKTACGSKPRCHLAVC